MRCGEFDAKIDRYVDGVLSPSEMADATRHADECTGCSDTVAQYQQVRVLLMTAVTDKVAAVDVSGLWQQIEARLDIPLSDAPPAWPALVRSWTSTAAATVRTLGSSLGIPAPGGAVWMAAAAGIALMIAIGVSGPSSPLDSLDSTSRIASKSVRIDSMEVGAGHSVSTWMRPRTGTRVIWVADATNSADASGFGVTNVSHGR